VFNAMFLLLALSDLPSLIGVSVRHRMQWLDLVICKEMFRVRLLFLLIVDDQDDQRKRRRK
jgi:hypothetical protein